MVAHRDEALWSEEPDEARPAQHSVLRSRSFWRTLFRLDVDEPELTWSGERHCFEYSGALSIESAAHESLLFIAGHEVARLDESVTMPHFFRWPEIKALARHFEGCGESPRSPSVATLLLAPFLAITEAERASVASELATHLERLGLLGSSEVSEIIEQRCVPDSDWVASTDLGFTLNWRKQTAEPGKYQASPIYSERVSEAPFGAKLVELLRAAGVSDV